MTVELAANFIQLTDGTGNGGAVTPPPATAALLPLGLGALGALRRRKTG